MNIDLSSIDNLFKDDLREDKGVNHSKSLPNIKSPSKDPVEALKRVSEIKQPKIYLKIDKEKEAHDKALKVYQEYQENIKKSQELKTEILKEIKLGIDPYYLLLKAIECISLMTADQIYYKQGKDDLQSIYRALGYIAPAEQEAQEVQERLNNLIKALEQEPDQRNKERIEAAIQAHKERKNYLLKLIS